jgi:formate dehydrogenase subunit delta
MNIEHLASMANDISNFFHAEPDHDIAVDSIAGHLKKFWEPRMRRQIVAYAQSDHHQDLKPLAREGVLRLAELDAAKV